MIGERRALEIGERVLWLMEEYVTLAGGTRSYGTDMEFHRLDIHLIHSIGKNPGINVTELASRHGITKSAVSQAVRKLERRSLIERYKAEDNRKEVRFRLNKRGRIAYDAHENFHRESEEPYIRQLAEFSEAEARGVMKLIEILEARAHFIRNVE